jgi:site-specific recombinase XerD
MRRHSVQGALRNANRRAGITKTGIAMHPRRPSYAPPLLEAGVNLRLIQRDLGHTRLATITVSLHLTQTGHEDAYTWINSRMQGLAS